MAQVTIVRLRHLIRTLSCVAACLWFSSRRPRPNPLLQLTGWFTGADLQRRSRARAAEPKRQGSPRLLGKHASSSRTQRLELFPAKIELTLGRNAAGGHGLVLVAGCGSCPGSIGATAMHARSKMGQEGGAMSWPHGLARASRRPL